VTTIAGLAAAREVLGGSVLGPEEIQRAFGFDPLAVVNAGQAEAISRVPFDRDALETAKRSEEMLVLRVPCDAEGPLTMLRLAATVAGGFDPKVHRGVGYQLRDEWTIDAQPFATEETCEAGWWLVRREPLRGTVNRTYGAQDAVLASMNSSTPRASSRRSAVEIAYDTLLWFRTHGERLLPASWDWSRSGSTDRGYAALGEFGPAGLGVIAYSRAVRFGTLGVCPQR
jgi:hypothetical protein